jgi:hypothetical protein
MERQWLKNWHATVGSAGVARGPAADRRRARIERAISASGARLIRLRIYDVSGGAPSATVVSASPAKYLNEKVYPVLGAIGQGPKHLLVLDRRGKLVLELWWNQHDGGGYRVRPELKGCGGWDEGLGVPPPCPA